MKKSLLVVIALLVLVLVVLSLTNFLGFSFEKPLPPPPAITLPSGLNSVSDCEVFSPLIQHYCPNVFPLKPKFINGSEVVANNPFAKLFANNESLQESFEVARRTNACNWVSADIFGLFTNESNNSQKNLLIVSVTSYPSSSFSRESFVSQKEMIIKDLSRNWSANYDFFGLDGERASSLRERLEAQNFVILDSSSSPNSYFALAKNGFDSRSASLISQSGNFVFFAQQHSGLSDVLPCESSNFKDLFSSV